MIVTGGARGFSVGNKTTRVYDDAGTLLWSADHGGIVYAVAADGNGNVYSGGNVASSATTRKYDSAGTLLWSANHGAAVNAIAVDAAGNVYTGGSRSGTITTRKYNSAGVQQWTADHGGTVNGIAVDAAGNVYTVGAIIGGVTLRKYAPDGTPGLTINFGNNARAVAVDPNGYIFQAGDRSLTYLYNLRRYSPDGTAGWFQDHNNTIYACAASPAGSAIMAGSLQTGVGARAFNSSGAEIPIGNPGADTLYGARFDNAENRILAGTRTNNKTLWKYNTSGALLWSADHGDTVFALAYAPSARVVEIPGLPLPFALGVPSTGVYVEIPSLALPFALGVPSVADAPGIDIAGRPVAKVYRAYLAGPGGSELLEIPMATAQCDRRLGASTWLSVTLETWTPALEQRIQSAIGGELTIYAGTRDRSGAETLGPFLRATLTEYRYEREPWRAWVTLLARVITPSYAATTRALQGVVSRNPFGRRWAVCDVDPLLRPNDTAIDGASSFIVGSISYTISPGDAEMTVTERGGG